ncbi:unnamed protein product [Kuraishia capsulata CBS 1993]|uniref:Uncharacterized protein n=1 Tax=Kuraishia capsulata CBS 1993 TaxID=1382522 RepID=W6MGE6_9ASCO|nr:uncharacterized protein KUCA_T00000529001 [Kuraishia capsulata CBS 1993]CDK24563.1 unnamed protein product [Kuraishia capsulata CBS 1993]
MSAELRARSMATTASESQQSETAPLLDNKTPKRKLYRISEIPEWQHDNAYILTHYIGETRSFRECFGSLAYLHNEIVNIYTHLVPGIVMPIVALLAGLFIPISTEKQLFPVIPVDIPVYSTTGYADYFFFLLFFAGVCTCLSLSATYHSVKCHSLGVAVFANQLDYLGIVILIVTSIVGILFYAFIDHPTSRAVFTSITLVQGVLCGVVSMKRQFRHHSWRPFRAAMFIVFGLSSVLPLGYSVVRYGFDQTRRRAGLSWAITEGAMYIGGAIIYALRIPERFAPGKFDVFGHSHQIFHVLVVGAASCHLMALATAYRYAHEVNWE